MYSVKRGQTEASVSGNSEEADQEVPEKINEDNLGRILGTERDIIGQKAPEYSESKNIDKEEPHMADNGFETHQKPSRLTSKETVIKRRNEKRTLRADKRFPDKLKATADNRALAESFKKHSAKLVSLFSEKENIEALFQNDKEHLPPVRSYDELQKILKGNDGEIPDRVVSYHDSSMKSSILYIATSFINSFLVEINLRRLFSTELPPITPTNAFLFRDLVKEIHDENKKMEILKILTPLYDKLSKGIPESFNQFFKNLDPSTINTILNNDMKTSDSFNSLEVSRLYFQQFKSGQYLNYDHSDYLREIQANDMVKFYSPKINNDEYLQGFEESFAKYEQQESKSASHLDLIINITRTLLQSNKFTPNTEIFQYLMDRFEKAGLYNYQSLVYSGLAPYKYRQTVLAKESKTGDKPAPSMAYQFSAIVSSNPEILSTLMRYHVYRKDTTSFLQMLSFYRLNEIIEHEKVLDKSYLSPLISKSRFIRNRDRKSQIDPVVFDTDEPILVSINALYQAIEGCIELGQYQFIDLLFNKIIVHAVEPNCGPIIDKESEVLGNTAEQIPPLKVALSFGARSTELIKKGAYPYGLLVTQAYTPDEFGRRIFSKDLLKLLLRASTRSDDLGRIMWLMPHLDEYLKNNVEEHKKKIAENRLESSPIDIELIREIYVALTTFGLEGKLVSYDWMLKFHQTVNIGEEENV